MKLFTRVLLVSLFLAAGTANALTVDEIIKLKQGGVSDETIQLLIRRDSDYRPSGSWTTKDGWIVHSTEFATHQKIVDPGYQNYYPLEIYPQVFPGGRRWR